ncbi:MAG: hypothetical protein JW820_00380 [Spirochaetales bacterium]|nr:hypothetical protein [Spirochaetales bacterium]
MTLVGIDIGTTTLSGLALDLSTGAILGLEQQANAFALPSREPDESLQDPEGILEACRQMLQRLLQAGRQPAGIGVTGQMHGILYVDGAGRALGPLYTWQDGRGEREYAGGLTYAQHAAQVTGASLATGMGVVTHFWNLRNGCVPRRAARVCTIADFVAMRLTGAEEPVTDASNAASLGCFDAERLAFRAAAVERIGMSPALLPRVVRDYPAMGSGPRGVPVFVPVGDNQASVLGAVRDLPRSAHVNIGTSSQINVYADRCSPLPGVDLRPFPFRGCILVGAGLCGGRAYSLLHDFFARTLRLFSAPVPPDALWEALNAVTPESLPNPHRLVVDARFQGTRSDPSIRGRVEGLGPENFTPEHLIVGLREGVAAELYNEFRNFGAAATRVETLVGSGNGVRLNPDLRRAFEQSFGMPMRVPTHREEAAFGAALLAGVAAGVLPDLNAAGRLIRYEEDVG